MNVFELCKRLIVATSEKGLGLEATKVLVTWEGTVHRVDKDNIYLSQEGCLVIDADNNHYKQTIMEEGLTDEGEMVLLEENEKPEPKKEPPVNAYLNTK